MPNWLDVVLAIRAIKSGEMTMRGAAKSFSLQRTSLRRYFKCVSMKYEDISTVTNDELKKTLNQAGYSRCAVKQVSKSLQTRE